jgi:hypothetical protein
VDVTEQPGVYPGRPQVLLCHVEIPLLGIQAKPLDVAVRQTDVDCSGALLQLRHPADPMLLAVLARAGAGMEMDFHFVAGKSRGALFRQG